MSRRRVLVFDVNETLLDLGALDPLFARVFGDGAIRREWFGTMLQSALLFTITGPYVDFGSHFRTALRQTAERHRVTGPVAPAEEHYEEQHEAQQDQLSSGMMAFRHGGMCNVASHDNR